MSIGTTFAGSILEHTTTSTHMANENALNNLTSILTTFSSSLQNANDTTAFSIFEYAVDSAAVLTLGVTCFIAYQTCKGVARSLAIRNDPHWHRNDSEEDSSYSLERGHDYSWP